jgi:hypothetical protein
MRRDDITNDLHPLSCRRLIACKLTLSAGSNDLCASGAKSVLSMTLHNLIVKETSIAT